MTEKKYDVAIVGATGAVGQTMLDILDQRDFPVNKVYALASERSEGSLVSFGNKDLVVERLDEFDFSKVQIALFSAGGALSEAFVPIAAEAGCICIDNTAHFRYDDDVPLVVPEVNPQDLKNYKDRMLIANPNCSTIQLVTALAPIQNAVGIERINVATYQAVSGAGQKGMEELAKQTAAKLNFQSVTPAAFSQEIAFNVIPEIDVYQDNGYTKEEMKMVWETRKILGDDRIQVNPTAVRVPVFYGHAEAVHIETREKISVEKVRELLNAAPGVTVIDQREPGGYPSPVKHAAGNDDVFVGRIREDISHPRGIDLWVVSDNVRKGAALNSVQIAEKMLEIM
ncbi:MAG: aspartate-semialdehyde dehydrogenase [bacterium]